MACAVSSKRVWLRPRQLNGRRARRIVPAHGAGIQDALVVSLSRVGLGNCDPPATAGQACPRQGTGAPSEPRALSIRLGHDGEPTIFWNATALGTASRPRSGAARIVLNPMGDWCGLQAVTS
jgi:hypothetical protein